MTAVGRQNATRTDPRAAAGEHHALRGSRRGRGSQRPADLSSLSWWLAHCPRLADINEPQPLAGVTFADVHGEAHRMSIELTTFSGELLLLVTCRSRHLNPASLITTAMNRTPYAGGSLRDAADSALAYYETTAAQLRDRDRDRLTARQLQDALRQLADEPA